MKCPICGLVGTVETIRSAEHEMVHRARVCDYGHKFHTYEVYPPTVRSSKRELLVTASKVRANAARWDRDQKIRGSSAEVAVLAAEYGLTKARIRQIQTAPRATPKVKILREIIPPQTQKGKRS